MRSTASTCHQSGLIAVLSRDLWAKFFRSRKLRKRKAIKTVIRLSNHARKVIWAQNRQFLIQISTREIKTTQQQVQVIDRPQAPQNNVRWAICQRVALLSRVDHATKMASSKTVEAILQHGKNQPKKRRAKVKRRRGIRGLLVLWQMTATKARCPPIYLQRPPNLAEMQATTASSLARLVRL